MRAQHGEYSGSEYGGPQPHRGNFLSHLNKPYIIIPGLGVLIIGTGILANHIYPISNIFKQGKPSAAQTTSSTDISAALADAENKACQLAYDSLDPILKKVVDDFATQNGWVITTDYNGKTYELRKIEDKNSPGGYYIAVFAANADANNNGVPDDNQIVDMRTAITEKIIVEAMNGVGGKGTASFDIKKDPIVYEVVKSDPLESRLKHQPAHPANAVYSPQKIPGRQ